MDYISEQQYQEDMQRIRGLRLIDDALMTACFDDFIEGAQLLLSIILDRDDLTVTEVKAQKVYKSLKGRDVWLDILATDSMGTNYDVEVQRADKGANRLRARNHSSMLDSNMLRPGDDFTDLKENYVIFITENDVLGGGLPIYHVNRFIEECSNLPFNDGEHIIYVNGSMRPSDTALGKLMSDMFCTDAKDMNYKLLSDKVRYLKETEEGVEMMFCSLEDMRNETEYKTKLRLAANLIANGKLSFEEIATLAELPLEKIKELAEEQSA